MYAKHLKAVTRSLLGGHDRAAAVPRSSITGQAAAKRTPGVGLGHIQFKLKEVGPGRGLDPRCGFGAALGASLRVRAEHGGAA
jgi:hypothetical protein